MSIATQSASHCINSDENVSIVALLAADSEANKVSKKREYNRNAQRAFRQRRKEHLRNLEAAQAVSNSIQVENVKRLRRDFQLLSQENESLKAAYRSPAYRSPATSHISTISPSPSKDIHYGALYPDYLGSIPTNASYTPEFGPSTLYPLTTTLASSVSTIPANSVLMSPHNIHDIRRNLYTMFSPLLEISVPSTSQMHLATLAALKSTLPNPLKPTSLQLSVPHDVYIDLIPSPSLRDRLIMVGPANASSFLTDACTIACDIEDTGQIIVWGKDWLNEFSWEFCPSLLERWGGFILGPEWGQRANFWRKQRRAPIIPSYD
ncbi:hypothetical protein PV08_07442 [Exophiala spinifera]|uniref:BZIP domain-containing protein n=1 Tax=Exophiala spinifera TaxID=91928 RepID=A0A0D2B6W5_9EURO|nr:uncharacterized protein PV08_07442 [Exophiala spinifera]KIW14658.1 hypothetical protein PV08_07442 [Exophiala spinifera]